MRGFFKPVLPVLSLVMSVCTLTAQQPDVRKNAIAFSEGLECKYKDDVQCAIKKFNEAIAYMPEDAASMFELSEQYAKAEHYNEGLEMIEKAVSIDPDNKWYKLRLARYYELLSMKDEMVATYEQLIEKEPQNIELLGELIEALEESLEYDRALKYLDKVEKVIGPNQTLTDERLKIYKQQGKTKKIVAELEKVVNEQPENSKYLLTLANLYMENGKEKDAVKLYNRVKQNDSEDKYASVALLEYYDKKGMKQSAFEELIATIKNKNLDLNTKSTIYDYWFGKAEKNETTSQQALECSKAFIETYPEESHGYIIAGTFHVNNNNMEEANKMFGKAVEYDSTNYVLWQNLLLSDFELKKYEDMTRHSVKALQFYPTQPLFYWFAGVGNIVADNKKEAIEYFERGCLFSTDSKITSDMDTHLGSLYYAIGEKDKAYKAYDRVLAFDPDNVLVLNNYAYYLSLDEKNLDKALDMSRRAVELTPDIDTYIDTYAWVLFKLGRYQEAEQALRKVVGQKNVTSGIYYEHYGDILFKMGVPDEAMNYWKGAKEIGNTSEKIDEKIEKGSL